MCGRRGCGVYVTGVTARMGANTQSLCRCNLSYDLVVMCRLWLCVLVAMQGGLVLSLYSILDLGKVQPNMAGGRDRV